MTLAEELPCVSRERGAYREAFQAPSSLSFFPRPVPWAMIAMRLRREDMGRSNGDRDSRRRRRQDSRREEFIAFPLSARARLKKCGSWLLLLTRTALSLPRSRSASPPLFPTHVLRSRLRPANSPWSKGPQALKILVPDHLPNLFIQGEKHTREANRQSEFATRR